MSARDQQIARQFTEDTANHQLTVKHEHGLDRRLRMADPRTIEYWYEVITTPGVLFVRGDMGAYVFEHPSVTDMLTLFRRDAHLAGTINPDYWTQKLTAASASGGTGAVKQYSKALFRQWVTRDFWDRRTEYSPADAAKLWALIRRDILGESFLTDIGDEPGAHDALQDFNALDFPEWTYEDAWEADWDEYDRGYLWCLHAIVRAITLYDRRADA